MVSSVDHDMAFLEHMLGAHTACMVSGRQGRGFSEFGQEISLIAMLCTQVLAFKGFFQLHSVLHVQPVILVRIEDEVQ